VSPSKVPFSYVALGKTTFQITTSIGKSLHTYDLRQGLNLTFLTRPSTPSDITAITSWKNLVFAAWGGGDHGAGGVWVFQRGKKAAELEISQEVDDIIHTLMVYGSWIVGCSLNRAYVWKSNTYEFHTTLRTNKSRLDQDGLTGLICTMPTYINKAFLGRRDGSVEIWNVSSGSVCGFQQVIKF
jgi:U3 small nucleolar RNA-associated protein 21